MQLSFLSFIRKMLRWKDILKIWGYWRISLAEYTETIHWRRQLYMSLVKLHSIWKNKSYANIFQVAPSDFPKHTETFFFFLF